MKRAKLSLSVLFCFMLFLLNMYPLFCNNSHPVIDSLESILKEDSLGIIELDNKEKIDIYNKLSRYYQRIDYIKGQDYGELALQHATDAGYKTGEAHAYTILGNIYIDRGKYEKALKYQLLAIEIRKETNDSLWLGRNLSNIAIIYDYQGEFEMALEYYFKSLRIKEKMNDYAGIAVTLNNIASVYYYLEKYQEALDMHFQAIEIEEKIDDKVGLVYSYNNIGEIYVKQEKLNDAEQAILKSITLNEEQPDNYVQSLNYALLVDIYHKMDRHNEALAYLKKSLRLNEQIADIDGITFSYLQIGRFYIDLGDINKAIINLKKSYDLAHESGYKSRITEAARELAKVYKERGKHSEAFKYMEVYANTKDSVYREESARQIEEMKTKYETEKKEKEIQIQNLQLAKNEVTIKKKNIALGSSTGGGFLFLIFVILIYLQYRKKNKAYQHLVKQNLEAVQCERMREQKGISPKKEIIDKYQKSTLSDKQKNEMISKLIDLMENDKVYTDRNLNVDELASRLDTNRTYLSQAINEYFRQNFNSMINEYRVKEARQLLTSEEFKHLSIEGIANQVGFNSKSSFNIAFKNFTGLTPSYYLNSVKYKEPIIG